MPEQNQPIQGAFGDLYSVETPHIDQATQLLQQQYAAREAFQQKTAANTDELLNKELANVRSVDAPQVFDAYSKWKNLATQMIGNQALQRNPKAYNAAQIEANAAYGQAMALINKSTNLNQFGKQLATDRATPTRSDLYADDFGDKASTFWNTPMDKLQQTTFGDLSNLDTYRYKGMNDVNFGDMEKKAAGTPAQRYQKEEQISPLQKNITPYSYGNTPAVFQSTLRGEYASNQRVYRAASAAWASIPQSERDRVDQLYSQIPPEKWQQMGLQGPQAIAPTNPQDPADNLAAYKAKLYAINNNPTAGKVYSNIDQGAKMKATFNQQDFMEALKEGDREKLASLRHQFKQIDVQQQSKVLDDTVNSMFEQGKQGAPVYNLSQDGKDVSKEFKLSLGGELNKALSIQNPDDVKSRIDPSDVIYNEQKGTVLPIFYKKGQPHTLSNIDYQYSKPMSVQEFKAIVGKTLFGVREAAKENPSSTTISSLRQTYGY